MTTIGGVLASATAPEACGFGGSSSGRTVALARNTPGTMSAAGASMVANVRTGAHRAYASAAAMPAARAGAMAIAVRSAPRCFATCSAKTATRRATIVR